jgi:hypothetical protein
MKNGSPEELDFTYDEDFAVFAVGSSKRKHLRRKILRMRKRIRSNQRGRNGR